MHDRHAPSDSGLLLIDKPAGMTSHDVVDRLRRLTGIRRIGHAGTLDPFATGLLILGIGQATKRLGDYLGLDKDYTTTAKLGATSSTFDPEGDIRATGEAIAIPSEEKIDSVLAKFRGGYQQFAPLFSAKKINGQRLYDLARRGQANEAQRPSKFVRIHRLQRLDYSWPTLTLGISCGSGAYIRSLIDDIGRALGVGAYAIALRRTRIGSFRLEQASSLTEISSENWQDSLKVSE